MMNPGFALLLTLVQFTARNIQAAELPIPENVDVFTLNTQYILTWDWSPKTAGNDSVTFTTEYMAKYKFDKKKEKDWIQVCVRSPDTQCDLTGSSLHYLGMYVFRVRASADGLNSDWVLKDFCPDKDAKLGPPSKVKLVSVGNLLEVVISDPLSSTGESMKAHVPFLSYRIHYWSRSADPQGRSPEVVDSMATRVTLPDLEHWTWYCVRVQTCYEYYNKSSIYTPAQCMQTEGVVPYWQIFLYFLASLGLCFLLVLLPSYFCFRCYLVLKSTFYPPIHFPSHIQEYLCDPSPGSDMPRLLTPESEVELFCDKLSVCPEAPLLEIHTPPPLAPGFMVAPPAGPGKDGDRHSRQGSGDSGVYSTEGGSAPAGGGSGQPLGAVEGSRHTLAPPEQVKMEKMAGEQADDGVMDEGVMDVCV